jgi:hypothetical protein
LAKNASYDVPHYAVFFSLLSIHPSSIQIFSSAPCSHTTSVYVPRLMQEIKFHIHTKQQAKLEFCIFKFSFSDISKACAFDVSFFLDRIDSSTMPSHSLPAK